MTGPGGAGRPRVFTIGPGVPYLATFVRAFLDGRIVAGFPAKGDPLELAAATIYVPTRRAAHALQAEFGRALPAPAALLPRIVPLGQLDLIETELFFDEAGLDSPPEDDLPEDDLPEAVSPLERRLVLMRMILAWMRAVPRAMTAGEVGDAALLSDSPAQAWHLAGELSGLIDEMIIEGIDWSALSRLVPEELDRYWSMTLRFLEIAMTQWPQHLEENGRIDAAARQAILVDREIERLTSKGAGGDPIVALGSTGTNRATARLIGAIARAPKGAVVLPGLDLSLDEAAWRSLGGGTQEWAGLSSHPQAALRRLLAQIAVAREEVEELGKPEATQAARARFVSEALRPAAMTDSWRAFGEAVPAGTVSSALKDVVLIEAADEREEALALAIALREIAETPGRTAALVTPDRGLARRVRTELGRWGIAIDDSGGEALGTSPYGALARLALDALDDAQPVATLALLNHRDVRLGLDAEDIGKRRRHFDIGIARALLPDCPDRAALIAAAREAARGHQAHPAAHRIQPWEWDRVADLLCGLDEALAPLRRLGERASLAEWAAAHAVALAALTRPRSGRDAAAGSEPGLVTAEVLAEIAASREAVESFDAGAYAAFFDSLARETRLRGPRQSHPRLKILGLLEARLLDADVVLLGGLDENVWPPKTQTDSFLSRPMRAAVGLSQPERRIGQTAHDFAMAMGNARVVISRAHKRNRAPTVASRFVQRMQALAPREIWDACRTRGEIYRLYARAIDEADGAQFARMRPEPRPPLDLRPTRLSVTRIETLRRDPYSIYAEFILRLKPLPPLGVVAGAQETGIDLHDILAEFIRRHPSGPSPADGAQELIDHAREKFAERLQIPAFRALRWPRIAAIFPSFVVWDAARRENAMSIEAEVAAALDIVLADGSTFKLTAIADRLEKQRDGTVRIIDYKSGRVPTPAEINAGFSPQLVLEAALLERGGFAGFAAETPVSEASHLRLDDSDIYEDKSIAKDKSIARLVTEQWDGLVTLLSQFRAESTAYVPRPYPQFALRFGTYDHLARVKEWATESEADE